VVHKNIEKTSQSVIVKTTEFTLITQTLQR
jgi:hypothetical protein